MAFFYEANASYDIANSARPTTEFNVTPYYEDYDIKNNYYRILYKPGYAVQARQLTQQQTILQNQIYRLGRHVFDEGSIVIPGGMDFKIRSSNFQSYTPIDYIKIKTNDINNNDVDVNDFINETITGQSNNVKAYVVNVADSDGTSTNTKTLFVTYTQAAGNIRVFAPGETLITGNSETAIVLDTDPVANTGYGSWVRMNDGVLFAKQHFIYFPTQSVVIDRYNPSPNAKIGFYITEQIVSAENDISLLDPALEASNYAAPGADRFKFNPQLVVVPLDYAGAEDFVSIATINKGQIEFVKNRSNYNLIGDEFAGRTYDESGDYIVSGFNTQVQEHYQKPTAPYNYGKYTDGNTSLLIANIEKGSGYAKGYLVNNIFTQELEIPKSKAYTNIASQITSTTMGQYLRVVEFVGNWEVGKNNRVNFYDQIQQRITASGNTIASRWSTKTQTGNNIGSAIFNSVQYVSGIPGYNAIYDVYLSDITMTGTNTISNIRSLYFDGSGADIGADVLGANNTSSNTYIRDINKATLLYPVGGGAVKTVNDKDGNPTALYIFSKTDSGTISTGGTVTITVSGANERLPYGPGPTVLSDTDVSQDILFNFNDSFNVALSGTVTASGTTVVGSGTNFDRLNVGDKIEISGQANTWYVLSIANATNMVVSNTMIASGNSIFKAYKVGDIVDFNGIGVTSGTDRTITATSTTLTFDIKETLPATKSISVTYAVAANLVSAATKTLKPNRFVSINCSSAGITGPYCLGFSDIYKIRNVVLKNGSIPSSTVDGTNVTNYFALDPGQKDTQYDLGYLNKSPGLVLGATDCLLVELDYFSPTYSTKSSYFTIDSYPIDDTATANNKIKTEEIPFFTSPVTKLSYNLRNYIDFRPVKNITANDSITVSEASTNPSNTSNSYIYSGLSYIKFPVPSSQMTYDFSNYLGRKDIIVIDRDGNFYSLLGEPSNRPLPKTPKDDQMVVAMLTIPPYPALSPQYARSLNRRDLAVLVKKLTNRRYTMRDIGVLDKRISNLEYYTALSLLEKNALDLKILDEAGIERFKNGIFVDAFKDETSSAKTYALDYRIALDPAETCIRPIFATESTKYNFLSGSGVTKHDGNLVTLNYDEVTFFSQKNVTDYRNLERGVYYYNGRLFLTPSEDIWVDTSFAPDENITITADNNTRISLTSSTSNVQSHLLNKNLVNTTWGNWNRTVTGVDVYSNGRLLGTFSTLEQAQSYASSLQTTSSSSTTDPAAFWAGTGDLGVGQLVTSTTTTTTTTMPDITYITRGTQTRIGTQTYNNSYTDSVTGDVKLVSSDIVPYMRPDSILVKGTGLKPKSEMHAFFDGIAVSKFCTLLTLTEFNAQYTKETQNSSYLPTGKTYKEGDKLIVNDNGTIYFIFRIPSDQPKFRVGEKTLTIIDGEQLADTISAEIDASTSASGRFYANGTKQVLQRTIYSTKGSFLTTTQIQETTSFQDSLFVQGFTNTTSVNNLTPVRGNSCMAYTVPINNIPNDENGIFVTAFDIFVQKKSSSRGLWFEIRECDSAGMVTNVQVPGSEVHYTNSQINVSTNGINNPTKVVFPFPVFLFNKKTYAFIIHSDNPAGANIDPDTTIWISRLGEFDKNTGLKINERQYKGAFFESINSVTYNLIRDVDLRINIYRANFNTSFGEFYIGNRPIERFVLGNNTGSLIGGDYIISGDILTLAGANGTISVTDRLLGNVSTGNANGTVVTVSGGGIYRLSNTKYTIGETVAAYNIAGYYTGVSATVSGIANNSAKIDYATAGTETFVDLYNSSGGFVANDIIRSVANYSTTSGKITSIYDYKYSVVDFEPKVLEFAKTGMSYEIAAYSNGSYSLGNYTKIIPGDYLYYDEEKSLYSRSTELVNLTGNKRSSQMHITMTSSSSYVSPVFDLDYSNSILIQNIINANTTGETGTFGGSAINRYISQIVTLSEDQDAEDMRVIITAYRPPATDVKVYAKILNSDDDDTIDNKSWIELEKQGDGDSVYSSLATRFDYKDYGYGIPAANLDANGIIQYNNGSVTYKTYRYFAIKIVLTSTNPAIIPKVGDLRVIAMQT